MKLIKIIALLAIGAIVGRILGLWVHDLTYQAWLNSGPQDRSGAALGGALAGLVQAAPILYAVVLSKRIYSAPVNPRSATNHQPNSNSIERDRRTGATLDTVYQPTVLKPQSQAPGSANSKVTNEEQRDEIEDYPRAAIAIKYRAEIAPDWLKIRSLPSEIRRMYLEKLDDNPDIDARELYAMVDERLKQVAAPFADDQTNKMYASLAQYGSEAQKRFRDIHDVLGVSFNAEQVANEISKDYSVEKFLEHINSGRYRTEKNLQFEKLPKGELILLSINGHSQGTKPFSISNFLIRYAEYSEDLRSSFIVDTMHIKKADGKLVEVTTDMNRFWVSSYLGEKQFDTITEVFDFLGTPAGYRNT